MDVKDPTNGRRVKGKGVGKLGGIIGLGFVGFETKSNYDEGDGLVMATGKALATNAFYSALPGGLIGGIALTSLPEIPNMLMATEGLKVDASGKGNLFSGSFRDTEATNILQDIGYQRQAAARNEAVKAMTSHNAQYARYFS